MSGDDHRPPGGHPRHGQIGYLQLPALDVGNSAAFFEAVFGWSVELDNGSFEAPGMIGQWTTGLDPTSTGGPVVWICVDQLAPTLQRAVANGGNVRGPPQLDNRERWLAEIDDPAGNRIGIVAPVRKLEDYLGCAVDVAELPSLKERVRDRVLVEAVPL